MSTRAVTLQMFTLKSYFITRFNFATDTLILSPSPCSTGLISSTVKFPPNVPEENGMVAGRPVAHYGAEDHACGTAVFVDDMKRTAGELDMVLVRARRAHANILSVDYSK